MADWKPSLYLAFGKERTQPAIDLVMKINSDNPMRIIDIGCGPGNSTHVLKNRWPNAEIIGLDSSQAMIEQARENYNDINWVCADASSNLSTFGKFDIVFSNAAIQWIPNQHELLQAMFNILNKNGVMAVQVPNTTNMPVHVELQKMIATEKWKKHFTSLSSVYSVKSTSFYYDILCSFTDKVDLWETDYYHVMNNHEDIVKWYSSTGLRVYLDCLTDENTKKEFLNDFECNLKKAYPVQKSDKVLFPFTRIFFIAYKN